MKKQSILTQIKKLTKTPFFVVSLLSAILIGMAIMFVLGVSSEYSFSKFDWDGVSGISDVLMTFVTLVLLLSIWQAKDAHDESTKARIQSTNASDAEVLKWAMIEIGKRKPDIKLVTDAYKNELDILLSDNKPHKYQATNKKQPQYTDQERVTHIENLSNNKKEEFYSNVEEINGENWNQEIKDALHKEVSIIMQRMGYMALFGLISKQHFINLWGPMFLASWYSIEWYIKEERKRLGENLELVPNPEEFIEQFGSSEGVGNRSYKGAFFRIHLEAFIKECEDKLPLQLVNNERKKFGRREIDQ